MRQREGERGERERVKARIVDAVGGEHTNHGRQEGPRPIHARRERCHLAGGEGAGVGLAWPAEGAVRVNAVADGGDGGL